MQLPLLTLRLRRLDRGTGCAPAAHCLCARLRLLSRAACVPPPQQLLVTVTCGTCRSTLQRPPGEGAVLCGVCGSFVRA